MEALKHAMAHIPFGTAERFERELKLQQCAELLGAERARNPSIWNDKISATPKLYKPTRAEKKAAKRARRGVLA